VQSRSAIASATLLLLLGIMYFGRLLPEGKAGSELSHAHGDVECQTCHSFGQSFGDAGSLEIDSRNCLDCHQTRRSENAWFHANGKSQDCTRCHSFHKPEFLIVQSDTMTLEFALQVEAMCDNCHHDGNVLPPVSEGHLGAARLIHSQRTLEFADAPSQFCLACHDATKSSIGIVESGVSAPRFHVSATHVFGEKLVPGQSKQGSMFKIQDDIPSDLVLIDGKIECQTCHSLVSSHEYLLTQRISDGMCTQCHDMQRDSESAKAFTFKS
jgi:predicted CXXCH cytochrome family protein